MGILFSALTFTGKLGNVIAYRRNGKICLRTKPETVRQTRATRQAAQWFGVASRKGALIRGAILPELDIHYDGNVVNRLNGAIVKAGRNNHGGLAGFQFNPHTSISKFFSQPLTVSPEGTLHIPPQMLKAQNGADHMEIKLIGTRFDFAGQRVISSDVAVLNIGLTEQFHVFEGADLSVDVPGKGVLVITLQVRFSKEGYSTCNKRFKAAGILAVFVDRPPVKSPKKPKSSKQIARLLPRDVRKAAPAAKAQVFVQKE